MVLSDRTYIAGVVVGWALTNLGITDNPWPWALTAAAAMVYFIQTSFKRNRAMNQKSNPQVQTMEQNLIELKKLAELATEENTTCLIALHGTPVEGTENTVSISMNYGGHPDAVVTAVAALVRNIVRQQPHTGLTFLSTIREAIEGQTDAPGKPNHSPE